LRCGVRSASWCTVGFFEVDQNGKLGPEIDADVGRQVRYRFFAIVDRTIIAEWMLQNNNPRKVAVRPNGYRSETDWPQRRASVCDLLVADSVRGNGTEAGNHPASGIPSPGDRLSEQDDHQQFGSIPGHSLTRRPSTAAVRSAGGIRSPGDRPAEQDDRQQFGHSIPGGIHPATGVTARIPGGIPSPGDRPAEQDDHQQFNRRPGGSVHPQFRSPGDRPAEQDPPAFGQRPSPVAFAHPATGVWKRAVSIAAMQPAVIRPTPA
jgi:hypothetical protein